jgi:hypothetical protein
MKRLGIVAVGLALVIGAVAVVFAVWASVAQAPWERTASTTSPRRVLVWVGGTSLTVCDVARDAFAQAESDEASIKGLSLEKVSDPEAAAIVMASYQSTRQQRLLALQLINDACPSGGTP